MEPHSGKHGEYIDTINRPTPQYNRLGQFTLVYCIDSQHVAPTLLKCDSLGATRVTRRAYTFSLFFRSVLAAYC